jgi:gas vesicle protein
MSGKTYALMFIGIILGGCVGYVTSLMCIPEAVDAYFPTNYRAQFDGLTEMYNDLSVVYDDAVSEIEGLGEDIVALQASIDELQGQYDGLDEAHTDLEGDKEALQEAYSALSDEHEALGETLNETQESYDALLMQYMIVTGTAPITPETQPEGTIRKDFAWEYGGETYALSLYIPQGLYDYYSNRTRVPTEDYSVYVTHPHDDDYLSTIIDEFDGIAAEEGYGETEVVSLVVAFVQSLPYSTDDITTDFDEYPRYPIETLVDGGGDCEDSSILTSALLDGMGYDCVLINPPEHVGVGVALDHSGTYWPYEGVNYYYVETTGEGWEIGELPEECQGQGANVYPILPIPIVTIDWTGSKVNHRVTLVIDVQNVGTGEAENIKVFFAHEGEEGEIWYPVESSFLDLAVGEEKAVALETDEPQGVRTRIVVRVLDAYGVIMEERHSTWFDTS